MKVICIATGIAPFPVSHGSVMYPHTPIILTFLILSASSRAVALLSLFTPYLSEFFNIGITQELSVDYIKPISLLGEDKGLEDYYKVKNIHFILFEQNT